MPPSISPRGAQRQAPWSRRSVHCSALWTELEREGPWLRRSRGRRRVRQAHALVSSTPSHSLALRTRTISPVSLTWSSGHRSSSSRSQLAATRRRKGRRRARNRASACLPRARRARLVLLPLPALRARARTVQVGARAAPTANPRKVSLDATGHEWRRAQPAGRPPKRRSRSARSILSRSRFTLCCFQSGSLRTRTG